MRESGEVECWGDNEFGQTEAPAGGLRSVSAGGAQSCGLRDAGWASWPVCWGERDFGQTDAVNAAVAVNLDRGRIVVRRLADGRIESAFRPIGTPTGGERILPPARYFPAAAPHGGWLRGSEIDPTPSAPRR